MSKEIKLIPELRFPEFEESGEWGEDQIGNVCVSYSGGTPSTSQKDYYGGEIPFIRSAEIAKNQTELFITEVGLENSSAKLIQPGDVLVALYGANSGDVALSKIKGAINQAILCLKSKVSNEFIYQFLTLRKSWIVDRYIQGGQGNLSGEIIKSITLLFPKPKEQQKIAACLSSLDELIEAENQKLEALKDHKKGLMQQIFPAEGEKVPKLRFPEFEDSGEWEEASLGQKDVSSFVNEKSPFEELDLDTYVSTENILPDYSGITTASKLPPSGSFTRFKAGDILISNIRPYLKKVWQSNMIGAASNDVVVVRASTLIDKTFLSFLLKNDAFINYIMKSAKGVKMPRGDKSSMQEYIVMFPSKAEQQKIASCLSSLDGLITTQGERIEALKLHKKGLMQGLFPSNTK